MVEVEIEESSKPVNNITLLLVAWSDGDPKALEGLAPLVYRMLHHLARTHMSRKRSGHLLQTTALIHEAYIRLARWQNVRWKSRTHFFGLVEQSMRNVLVDFARTRDYAKRGGGMRRVGIDEAMSVQNTGAATLLDVDDALRALERVDAFKSKLVELRFLAELTLKEAAVALNVSPRTAAREWSLARAWLCRELLAGGAPLEPRRRSPASSP
jgi:RNA polymerase sigma factor (TIGR02999 family)